MIEPKTIGPEVRDTWYDTMTNKTFVFNGVEWVRWIRVNDVSIEQQTETLLKQHAREEAMKIVNQRKSK